MDKFKEEEIITQGFPEFTKEDALGFNIKSLDLHIKSDIISMAVGKRTFVVLTSQREVIQGDFNNKPITIALPCGKSVIGAVVYMDLYGYHCIVLVSSKEVYYLESGRVCCLVKLSGKEICSIAFGSVLSKKDTGVMLIGTSDGWICSYRIRISEGQVEEENLSKFSVLPSKEPIYGLLYESYSSKELTPATLIIAVTNETCYQFYETTTIDKLLSTCSTPKKLQSLEQKNLQRTELKPYYKYTPDNRYLLSSFIWKTGVGVCYADIKANNLTLEELKLKTYGRQDQYIPNTISIDNYYIFLIYKNNLTIISRDTDIIEYSEDLKVQGDYCNMIYHYNTHSIWFQAKHIVRIIEIKEKSEWRYYLEKGNYKEAMILCKNVNEDYARYCAGLYADEEFEKGNYLLAADSYFQSNRSFEEVSIKLLLSGNNEALQHYLIRLLLTIDKIQKNLIKLNLLCSWLIQLKLDRLNELAGMIEGLSTEETKEALRFIEEKQKQFLKELYDFLFEYKDFINPNVVLELLQGYGKLEICLWFAKEKQNHEAMVLYYISNQRVKDALKVVSELEGDKKNQLMISYISIFINYAPEDTISSLCESFKSINAEYLIPAIPMIESKYFAAASNFIKQHIDTLSNSLLYNLYIMLLAQANDDNSHEQLLEFFRVQEKQSKSMGIAFDKSFGIMLFKFLNMPELLIRVYGIFNLYEAAVNAAIEYNCIELGKKYANMPSDQWIRKELWLSIARYVMENNSDVQTTFELINESNGSLTLNEILKYIAPKVKLKFIRDDVLSQVNDYDTKILHSKSKLRELNEVAKEIGEFQREVIGHPIHLPTNMSCNKCNQSLTNTEPFYAFPCRHAFHLHCLLDWYDRYKCESKAKMSKIQSIEEYKKSIATIIKVKEDISSSKSLLTKVEAIINKKRKTKLSEKEYTKLKIIEKKFVDEIASECILCGDIAIERLDAPYDSLNEFDWFIDEQL